MTTQLKSLTKSKSRRYGVTEKKKAELDALSLAVLDAQQQVDQYQSIVTSLTTKQSNFQALLAVAETNRTNALNNKNMVEQVVQNYLDLQNNSAIAFNGIAAADKQTTQLAESITNVMNKLIYSAEVINKLATFVVRKKALNPLVSDELVSVLNTAGTDANNAVALTLVALQSTFAAQASNIESESAFSLEYLQAMAVYQFITGTDENGNRTTDYSGCLQALIDKAYRRAKAYYKQIYDASLVVTSQLNQAQLSLNEAQIQLSSLQAGLAAGNAAALAS